MKSEIFGQLYANRGRDEFIHSSQPDFLKQPEQLII